ncbi:DUF819 family protein [Muricauda sp. CAU 1633]|uniref:DUF819 family protein n=1 Tax=Allomuricauda sp. CAU 1633 TaxID=2816036 RepID=UPI001A905505|nr:DUF819 family protein [Muricauda sp. CAU 1633]MBO0324224.1 DUF819 family protein [Muricauda sp. CAU 1633]
MDQLPFTDDTVIFGLLCLCLGFVFYTSSIKTGFWTKFYGVVPTVLMCYLLPGILASFGIISAEQSNVDETASNFLLPAALILMTLSIDLKAIINLGSKALIMFFTGTVGIIIGGPLAILIVSIFSPDTVGGVGIDAVWRGLATIAGSWIGGSANQIAMLEIFEFNESKYSGMVLVDIIMANLWLGFLLFGVGKTKRIDTWLKADTSSIEQLKQKVSTYTQKIARVTSLSDLMMLLFYAFVGVGLAHFLGQYFTEFLVNNFEIVRDKEKIFSSLGSPFLWMVVFATIIGIGLSFTKAKNYEGAGASKIGGMLVYVLVATVGMKMDLSRIAENPGLIIVGFVWITIHAGLLILVAKLIKAPYFFLAVGSQANVGGAASAPVVAAEFHPSLTSVGILLAVFGYVVGTAGAYICALLMEVASKV